MHVLERSEKIDANN